MRTALIADRILDPEDRAPRDGAAGARPCVLIEDGRLVETRRDLAEGAPLGPDWRLVERPGSCVAPGFLDLHVHGGFAAAAPDELTQALARDARAMLEAGTTGFLATSIAQPHERQSAFADAVAACDRAPSSGAHCLGLHFEGPWINDAAPGALDPKAIRPFHAGTDGVLLERAEGLLRMVTLAPEIDGADALLDTLARRGVVAAMGHTAADGERIAEAAGRGLRHVTHLFNAMGPIHHREPGVAFHALAEERLSCDLICDGVHVHPVMLRAAAHSLGERLLLITDRFDLPGLRPEPGAAADHPLRLPSGALAGSQLGMDGAVRGLRAAAGVTLREAVEAATLRPARLLGVESQRGTLRPGARADLVVLSEEGEVQETWLGGECAVAPLSP